MLICAVTCHPPSSHLILKYVRWLPKSSRLPAVGVNIWPIRVSLQGEPSMTDLADSRLEWLPVLSVTGG